MIAQFFIAVRQQVEGIAQQVRGRCYCGEVILGGIIRGVSICRVFQLYPVQRAAQFDVRGPMFLGIWIFPRKDNELRSEEHTSELQSRENIVCRLLLEK